MDAWAPRPATPTTCPQPPRRSRSARCPSINGRPSLRGLARDARYCYRIAGGGAKLLGPGPAPTFRSQVPAGSTAPFSFAVLGDWGLVGPSGENIDQENVIAQIAASGARFAITTGDTAYPDGSQLNYGDLQQTGSSTSSIFGPAFWAAAGASIPMFNAQGNHGLKVAALTNWPQDKAVASSGGRYQMDTYCCENRTTADDLSERVVRVQRRPGALLRPGRLVGQRQRRHGRSL